MSVQSDRLLEQRPVVCGGRSKSWTRVTGIDLWNSILMKTLWDTPW